MSVTKGDWERFCDLIKDARRKNYIVCYNDIPVIGVPISSSTKESVIILTDPNEEYTIAGDVITRRDINKIDLFMYGFTVIVPLDDACKIGIIEGDNQRG